MIRWLAVLKRGLAGVVVSAGLAPASFGAGLDAEIENRLRHLVAVYPDALERIDGDRLIWRDGTPMPIDDGRGAKSPGQRLATADIKDMELEAYPLGTAGLPPARGADPGRARNAAFFDKMYGDCGKGQVQKALVAVAWLPRKWGRKVLITPKNGVAAALQAVSQELDALPATFDKFLFPPAGTFNCRDIAGTTRKSAHGHGIAIDLAAAQSTYWRWVKPDAAGHQVYRNRMPLEIVAIFEQHGFIWGGKWSHYDSMHFEYRPELLSAKSR